MDFKEQYRIWSNKILEDIDLKDEILKIKDNELQKKENFFKNLEFGTGGLRGIIGVGTNRINIYTIRKATQGFCNYLKTKNKDITVAISYDSRTKSELFAKECAKVLAGNGFKAIITDTLMPTPFLSFLVSRFNCQGGIMITASHNPFIYNGYKAYDENGCQLTDVFAEQVIDCVNDLDIFKDVKIIDFDKGVDDKLIKVVSNDIYDEYLNAVLSKDLSKDSNENNAVKIVYTPLNGAGFKPVTQMMKKINCNNFIVVKEQQDPDGKFPTCPYPNPEIKEALELSLELAKNEGADIVMATDPDSDRLGVCVKDSTGEFRVLTGNEIGILMLDYIVNTRKKDNTMPEEPMVVKTIVSSKLIDKICKQNNIKCVNVLTGFKYIGEQIEMLSQKGEQKNFIFGYEESFGYLTDGFVRDKDAVLASMHIIKMANIYKGRGENLLDRLDNIYKEYGYIQNTQTSHTFLGVEGMEKMQNIMADLRKNKTDFNIDEYDVLTINDYMLKESLNMKTGKIEEIKLPKSNVIEFIMNKGASIIIRPSGTEPKIKAYICANGDDLIQNKKILKDLLKVVEKIFS